MHKRTLSPIEACEAAGYNRDRLNEYIASGVYACAPPTVPGRARQFDLIDTVTLYFFANLMESERVPSMAALEACLIGRVLREKPDAKVIYVAKSHFDDVQAAFADEEGLPYAADPDSQMVNDLASGHRISIRSVRAHNVAHAVRYISHEFNKVFQTEHPDE